jgi:hypothetical protein
VTYVIRAGEREWFKRCRRAWDLGSRSRQDLEPLAPEPVLDLGRALRFALALYYYPGMWEWPRAVVLPKVFDGFALDLARQRESVARALTEDEERDWEEQASAGRQLLEAYLEWAPGIDRFVPVRVGADFDVQIPDPRSPGHDLVSPAGEVIRYQGRVDLLVVDEHDAYWVVEHRLAVDGWAELDELVLGEDPVAACWAWELFYLGMRITGTIHNELRLPAEEPTVPQVEGAARRPRARDWARARAKAMAAPLPGHRRMYAQSVTDPGGVVVEEGGDLFRRTRIPRGGEELGRLGIRLAEEALDMVDPALRLYPSPRAESCSRCHFRRPCIAMNEGADPAVLLDAAYRRRPPEGPEEGRLGGSTWSMNRGAAPPPQWSRGTWRTGH